MPKESFNEYWIDRTKRGDIKAVGLKSFSKTANHYLYKPLFKAFSKIINQLSADKDSTFLDIGAGIGLFSEYLYHKHFQNVTAVDVSENALKHIDLPIKKIVSPVEALDDALHDLFDTVYCFDVLYHIIPDQDFELAIRNICNSSKSTILIHGFYPRVIPIHLSKHVKFRTLRKHNTLFKKYGFRLDGFEPTHAIMMRISMYKIFGLFPKLSYTFDTLIIRFFKILKIDSLCSHKILMYKRIANT